MKANDKHKNVPSLVRRATKHNNKQATDNQSINRSITSNNTIKSDNHRRFGRSVSGPINASQKRLDCPAVMGARPPLLLPLLSAKFSCSLFPLLPCGHKHAILPHHYFAPSPSSNGAILHPSSHPQPKKSGGRLRQNSFILSRYPSRPHHPGFSISPDMIHFGNLRSSIRMNAPAFRKLLVRTLEPTLSQPVHCRVRSYKRVRWSPGS